MRIEPPPPRVHTTRLAEPGHGPAIVALSAAGFMAVAILSAVLASGPTTAPRLAGAGARLEPPGSVAAVGQLGAPSPVAGQPSPTSEPSLRPGEIACAPAGWRLAYVGSIASMSVETSLVIEPAIASGPLDPGIPVADLGHDVVSGLGACAPPVGSHSDGRPAVIERAWRLGRTGASDVALPIGMSAVVGSSATAPDPRPDALTLVRPSGTGVSWASGAYVLELAPSGAAASAPSGAAASAPSVSEPLWLRIELDPPTP